MVLFSMGWLHNPGKLVHCSGEVGSWTHVPTHRSRLIRPLAHLGDTSPFRLRRKPEAVRTHEYSSRPASGSAKTMNRSRPVLATHYGW